MVLSFISRSLYLQIAPSIYRFYSIGVADSGSNKGFIIIIIIIIIIITSSNQRLWECVRCRINVYPDTLNDFPSWLSTSKNKPFFINNRGFTERYFSDKVHASLMIEDCVAWRRQLDLSFRVLFHWFQIQQIVFDRILLTFSVAIGTKYTYAIKYSPGI